MKKLITFSLWGNNRKYTNGAIKNAELALQIYPDWICRFYTGKSVPIEVITKLKSFDNVEVIEMDEDGSWNSMFWRFYAASDENVEVMISRDCDSRLSLREKLCVDEFLSSDKLFHSIIDHPFHSGIMGGMWGVKKGILSKIISLIDSWDKTNKWQTDQSFLNTIIKPIISNTYLLHDSINLKNFLSKREDYHFVGEVFDENDVRFEHWGVLTSPEYND